MKKPASGQGSRAVSGVGASSRGRGGPLAGEFQGRSVKRSEAVGAGIPPGSIGGRARVWQVSRRSLEGELKA